MKLSRRELLAVGAGTFVYSNFAALPAFSLVAEDVISALTAGAELGEGLIDLVAPEIAENGNAVPLEVSAPGASSITLFADGNPEPVTATFNFGPLSPTSSASTRVRLAKTQNVVALAKMADGSWQIARAAVKVTIGGCGG